MCAECAGGFERLNPDRLRSTIPREVLPCFFLICIHELCCPRREAEGVRYVIVLLFVLRYAS